MQYQLENLEQFEYSIAPDDPAELQLASALARISELQSSKNNLQMQIMTAMRELEIKRQLLQNALVRERELRMRF